MLISDDKGHTDQHHESFRTNSILKQKKKK